MQIIGCHDITLAYDGSIAAKNVSLSVDEGDYLCIVGENGTGKSTLIKGMLGLIKPVSGHVSYSGISRREIGYIPQQTPAQKDFPASVREVVLSGCLNKSGLRPFFNKKEKACAESNMKLLGISDISDKCYRELSGGQQQRVLLARALCAADRVLFLDEPASGLDPAAVTELYALLSKLNRENGLTVVMVSHDVGCVSEYATKILHMANEVLFFGSVDEYKSTDLGHSFLGDKTI